MPSIQEPPSFAGPGGPPALKMTLPLSASLMCQSPGATPCRQLYLPHLQVLAVVPTHLLEACLLGAHFLGNYNRI